MEEREERLLMNVNLRIVDYGGSTGIEATVKIKSTDFEDYLQIQKTMVSFLRANPDYFNVMNMAVGALNDIIANQPAILADIDKLIAEDAKKINFNHK